MTISEIFSAFLLITGSLFFLAGTIGLLRFPDVFTRLHALTKADNLGLGLIVFALIIQADSISTIIKLLLNWLLVLLAGASPSYLIAQGALERRVRPWRR